MLVFATTSADKAREARAILPAGPLLTLADFPVVAAPDETGGTFEENARLKAGAYVTALARWLDDGVLLFAEDSGLVIDALNGEPGVHSARYLGPGATYADRFRDIERRLSDRPAAARTARFVCAVAVVDRGGALQFETTGTVDGLVTAAPAGAGGFGYDPILFYPPYGKTLAEATEAEKHAVSHRGQALGRLAQWLTHRA
jgi:XTP/dITP diphosphohydrolase